MPSLRDGYEKRGSFKNPANWLAFLFVLGCTDHFSARPDKQHCRSADNHTHHDITQIARMSSLGSRMFALVTV